MCIRDRIYIDSAYNNPNLIVRYSEFGAKFVLDKETAEAIGNYFPYIYTFYNSKYSYFPIAIAGKVVAITENGNYTKDIFFKRYGVDGKVPIYLPDFTYTGLGIYKFYINYTFVKFDKPVTDDWFIYEVDVVDKKYLTMNVSLELISKETNVTFERIYVKAKTFPIINNTTITDAQCSGNLFIRDENGTEYIIRSDIMPVSLIYNKLGYYESPVIIFDIPYNSNFSKWAKDNGIYFEAICRYLSPFKEYVFTGKSENVYIETIQPSQYISVYPTTVVWFQNMIYILIAAGIGTAIGVFNQFVGLIAYVILLAGLMVIGALDLIHGIPAILIPLALMLLFRYVLG